MPQLPLHRQTRGDLSLGISASVSAPGGAPGPQARPGCGGWGRGLRAEASPTRWVCPQGLYIFLVYAACNEEVSLGAPAAGRGVRGVGRVPDLTSKRSPRCRAPCRGWLRRRWPRCSGRWGCGWGREAPRARSQPPHPLLSVLCQPCQLGDQPEAPRFLGGNPREPHSLGSTPETRGSQRYSQHPGGGAAQCLSFPSTQAVLGGQGQILLVHLKKGNQGPGNSAALWLEQCPVTHSPLPGNPGSWGLAQV